MKKMNLLMGGYDTYEVLKTHLLAEMRVRGLLGTGQTVLVRGEDGVMRRKGVSEHELARHGMHLVDE